MGYYVLSAIFCLNNRHATWNRIDRTLCPHSFAIAASTVTGSGCSDGVISVAAAGVVVFVFVFVVFAAVVVAVAPTVVVVHFHPDAVSSLTWKYSNSFSS